MSTTKKPADVIAAARRLMENIKLFDAARVPALQYINEERAKLNLPPAPYPALFIAVENIAAGIVGFPNPRYHMKQEAALEFAALIALQNPEQTPAPPEGTGANELRATNGIKGYTLLTCPGDYESYQDVNNASYPGRPESYPCLVKPLFDAEEETYYTYLYHADIAAMQTALLLHTPIEEIGT